LRQRIEWAQQRWSRYFTPRRLADGRAILVSTFGCANGLTLAGARVYYAMSQDGLFFSRWASFILSSKRRLPAGYQAVWATFLCLSGSYGQLLDYIIFAVLLFYILTIAGLFVLASSTRMRCVPTRPSATLSSRRLHCDGGLDLYRIIALQPQYTWPGLVLVLLGIPVYLLWSRRVPA